MSMSEDMPNWHWLLCTWETDPALDQSGNEANGWLMAVWVKSLWAHL